jgi:hypothetical protein
LDVPPGLAYDPIREAIAAIDSVHGDGDLVPIRVTLRSFSQREGRFRIDPTNGTPDSIEVVTAARPRLAVLHEIGHFLDYAGIGSANRFASETSSLMRPWRDAVRNSRAFSDLALMRRTGVAPVHSPGEESQLGAVDLPYVQYLLKYNELWARSYVQFIALGSRDRLLRTDLDARRLRPDGMVYVPRSWDDEDYEPIERMVETLFRRLKWIT